MEGAAYYSEQLRRFAKACAVHRAQLRFLVPAVLVGYWLLWPKFHPKAVLSLLALRIWLEAYLFLRGHRHRGFVKKKRLVLRSSLPAFDLHLHPWLTLLSAGFTSALMIMGMLSTAYFHSHSRDPAMLKTYHDFININETLSVSTSFQRKAFHSTIGQARALHCNTMLAACNMNPDFATRDSVAEEWNQTDLELSTLSSRAFSKLGMNIPEGAFHCPIEERARYLLGCESDKCEQECKDIAEFLRFEIAPGYDACSSVTMRRLL